MLYSKALFAILCLLAERSNANKAQSGTNVVSVTAKTGTTSAAAKATSNAAVALNNTVLNCVLTLPDNALEASGLATPFLLQPPCSMAVPTQQAFAEAAIYDPATGAISIYHPLISNVDTKPAAPPVVPTLPIGAVVGLWFGFNGGVLQLADVNGKDTNNSPTLTGMICVNGLPGTQGDVFGQVSWCNAENWFKAANAGIAAGKTVIPDLGVDKLGNPCPTSRSFEITDACPSDNVPTQYILVGDATAQDTTTNRAAMGTNSTIINNASDEALLTNILDPLIGCKPFVAPSLDNPDTMVPALVLSELQAAQKQAAPNGLVPLNDPDCLLTADGAVSHYKTNAYRLGVNQPIISNVTADTGALIPYCKNMVAIAPAFFKGFEATFIGQTTPAANVGSNLFTFLCERYLMSLTQLTCPPSAIPFQPVVCKTDGNGVATSCTINLANGTTTTASKAGSTSKVATSKTAATSTSAVSLLATSSVAKTTALAVVTSTKASPSALATSSVALTKTTTTITIEIISFFIFTFSLGGVTPGVTINANAEFIVLEEIFIDLPSAASAACTHQFNSCAALAGLEFQGTDCLAQHNQCQGSASTVSQTASTPGTVTATATMPASATASGLVSSAAAGGLIKSISSAVVAPAQVTAAVGGAGAGGNAATCPAALTVSACTAVQTVTVTQLSGASGFAAPTVPPILRHRHVKARRDW